MPPGGEKSGLCAKCALGFLSALEDWTGLFNGGSVQQSQRTGLITTVIYSGMFVRAAGLGRIRDRKHEFKNEHHPLPWTRQQEHLVSRSQVNGELPVVACCQNSKSGYNPPSPIVLAGGYMHAFLGTEHSGTRCLPVRKHCQVTPSAVH